MSEGLANVGSIEMAQGTWSQLFIIIKSQILQAEDGMATREEPGGVIISAFWLVPCFFSDIFPSCIQTEWKGRRSVLDPRMPIPTCQDSVSEPRKASLINCGTLSTNPQVFFDLSRLPPTNY